jgi:hypothetical protein
MYFHQANKHIAAILRVGILSILLLIAPRLQDTHASGENFTADEQTAQLFGVHEITLQGGGSVRNPFNTIATVTFTPPSGTENAKTVDMFYDGENIWRARAYVTEVGEWTWESRSPDRLLDGHTGDFMAVESDLRGMLKTNPNNPHQWITDDGQWFLNINDTAYRLFNGGERRWQAYVEDLADLGVTTLRAGVLGGFAWDEGARSSNYPWQSDDFTRYNLEKFQVTDTRMQWMLDQYPDMYIQMILFGQIDWQTDEVGEAWADIPQYARENTLRYMMARWAAYPQVFWLGVNDLGCTEEFPNNRAFGREVGQYVAEYDPWGHLVSVSAARGVPFCYLEDEDTDWVSYIHLQDGHAFGAELIEQYEQYPMHIFLGEDYYEQDTSDRHPRYPDYSQRWLFWSWTLSGGSASYGGRYPYIHPYSQTGELEFSFDGTAFGALTGLDSAPYILPYFTDRDIDLSLFQPDDSLVIDLRNRNDSRHPELMRREFDEFLIYHPNALEIERFAQPDPDVTPGVEIDLSTVEGVFSVEWYRPKDGLVQDGENIRGSGLRDLVSPWRGDDFVLRLVRIDTVAPPSTSTPDDGRVHDGLQALYTFDENAGSIVYDVSGSTRPINLIIDNPEAVSWSAGGLTVNTPTLISSQRPVTALLRTIQESNEVTMEAWIRPADPTQDGPARIVTLSTDTSSRTMTLGQNEGTDTPTLVYNVRLRTTETDLNGEPAFSTPPDTVTDQLTQIVYTRDASGQVRFYINGEQVAETELGGDLSNWEGDSQLALANEISQDRPWLGEFRLVALYNRALTPDEVRQNWRLGADP